MANSSANYTPESDSGKIDVNEAKRRLATIKQGTEGVVRYFDKCRQLVEIVNGGQVERQDSYLFAVFMNGLTEKTRKVIQMTGANDAFTARKHAIPEEMFTSLLTLQPGNDEDRIHKIEVLNHCQWEKLRLLEGKLNYVQNDVHQMKKDVSEVKEMMKQLLEQTVKKSEKDPTIKENSEALKKVLELNETVVAKLEPLEKIDKLSTLGLMWTRQVHNDLARIAPIPKSQTPPTAPPTSTPSPSTSRPTRPIPNKIASPIIPVAPKRSHNSNDGPSSPQPKRLRPNEEKVLDSLRSCISNNEFQSLFHGNITVNVVELYQKYSKRSQDIDKWMEQRGKPVTHPCMLCGERHHPYECDRTTSIDERRRLLKQRGHCMECSKRHKGTCTAILECRICRRAYEENQTIIGGVKHCRMFCPLQEEYHMTIDKCDQLLEAKKILESS